MRNAFFSLLKAISWRMSWREISNISRDDFIVKTLNALHVIQKSFIRIVDGQGEITINWRIADKCWRITDK
jgi:hypothetical protein